MRYFSADFHFGHSGIIKLARRPWNNVDEMDEGLIELHNQTVTDADIVYYIGDFAFKTPERYLTRLKGKEHHLIMGNHDYRQNQTTLRRIFDSVQDVLYLRFEKQRFFLSHYAHRTWRNSIHGSYHLYGHSHGSLPDYNRSMDVGVDAQNYRPVSIEEVVQKLSVRPITTQHPE